jgi:RNA polymerase-associated protein CTR9
MIQQKSVEMLFALPPNKRSLADLQRAIDQASHAQK